VRIFKMRRRKHYQKHGGHRQGYTEVFVGAIDDGAGGSTTATAGDNLEVIEGIGPKIAAVLAAKGIATYAALAAASADDLKSILSAAGNRFALADASTWPQQAALLRDGKMDEFRKLTDELVGGVRK
jgi:hypothetical protein